MEGVAKAVIRTQEQKAEAPDKKVAGAGFSFSEKASRDKWNSGARTPEEVSCISFTCLSFSHLSFSHLSQDNSISDLSQLGWFPYSTLSNPINAPLFNDIYWNTAQGLQKWYIVKTNKIEIVQNIRRKTGSSQEFRNKGRKPWKLCCGEFVEEWSSRFKCLHNRG